MDTEKSSQAKSFDLQFVQLQLWGSLLNTKQSTVYKRNLPSLFSVVLIRRFTSGTKYFYVKVHNIELFPNYQNCCFVK